MLEIRKVIPDIIYSNKRENRIADPKEKDILDTTTNKNYKTHNNIYHTRNKRKNGRCFICKKYGHYASDCRHNRNNNKYKSKKIKSFRPRTKQYKRKPHFKTKERNQALITTNDNYKNLYEDAFIKDYNSDLENSIYYINNTYNEEEYTPSNDKNKKNSKLNENLELTHSHNEQIKNLRQYNTLCRTNNLC